MWEGFSKKLEFYDKDGTTIWSEAQAEWIFLILGFIIENKSGLSVQYMFQLFRVVKEGLAPATKAAMNISKNAIEKYQGKSS